MRFDTADGPVSAWQHSAEVDCIANFYFQGDEDRDSKTLLQYRRMWAWISLSHWQYSLLVYSAISQK
jgi:hypothetical protein